VVNFLERYCRHHEAEWAGQLIRLEEWQKRDVLRPIFGWKVADGRRRFRTAYIEIPRKNGKTFACSGLGLYLLIADGEPGAQIFSSATKEEQAAIAWSGAAKMTRASPDLKRFTEVHGFKKKTGGTIFCERTGGFFRPLGADSQTLDGLNPHANIVDELHAHVDRGVWDVLDTAMGARRQPIIIAITTAGVYDQTAIGWQKHEYAQQVLDGAFEDDSFFAFIAAIDDEDDPLAPASWRKANPNFGVSVKPDDMERQAKQAVAEPGFYNTFLRLRLNRWTQQITRWIPPEKWKACDPLTPAQALERRAARELALEGQNCWVGLDLSQRSDLTAAVLSFRQPDDTVEMVLRCWLPEETIKEQERKGRKHYAQWEREGWLTATPGEVIDYAFIRRDLNDLSKRFRFQEIAYDPHDAQQIATELGEQDGFTMVEMRQGFLSMSEPSKTFAMRTTGRTLRHGGNPVFAWAVGNAVIKTDAAGNIKPDKEHAKDKMDPVTAAVMSLRGLSLNPDGGGAYDTRGVRTL
jgi:phage terminase large subunit-like protein